VARAAQERLFGIVDLGPVDVEEAFLCGSGHEIEPILSVDRHKVGAGLVGELTRRLQRRYFDLVRGETNEHADWLTPVYSGR